MRAVGAIAAVVIGLLAASPSATAVAGSNKASTTTFIGAAGRLVSAELGLVGRGEAAANALITHVRSACPGAIPNRLRTGPPARQAVWVVFQIEAAFELGVAQDRPLKPAVSVFIARTAHLRWTDQALNRAIADLVDQLRTVSSLRPPDLCIQAKLAKSSGYSIVPPGTGEFVSSVSVGDQKSGPGTGLRRLMERMSAYMTVGEARAARHVLALDHRLIRLNSARFERQVLGRLQRALFSCSSAAKAVGAPGCWWTLRATVCVAPPDMPLTPLYLTVGRAT